MAMSATDFFNALSKRSEQDSAVIANLRRSASYEPGLYPPAFPYVEPYVQNLSEWRRTATYLTAACRALATRREHGDPLTVPRALRALQARSPNSSTSIEKRFQALLDADTDELPWRLRHVINQLAASGTAIDWPGLLDDLRRWPDSRRTIQVRWARQFWSASENNIPSSETARSRKPKVSSRTE